MFSELFETLVMKLLWLADVEIDNIHPQVINSPEDGMLIFIV